ncbi:hypothetical protein Tsubulata_017794 [Turnera subulata]|uniref:AIG1-type G domain-containing protein n=1 Tax=Turnera subulata TaxID=218843 RepID=A0A9Q0FZL8_9ROSI|nr:hypothetical protein Tsubulata_017794 [Turnera subulata]
MYNIYMSNNRRNIVLIGKTGNGKSSTGNSILMQKGAFEEAGSLGSVTQTTQMESTTITDPNDLQRYTVNVVDTPGLFDGTSTVTQVSKEIIKCMTLAKEGIHAFIVVLRIGNRFSEEEAKAIDQLEKLFGPEAVDHMIVVFTRADDLESPEEWPHILSTAPPLLQNFLDRCHNRIVLFNNKAYKLGRDKEKNKLESQRRELLHLINQVMNEKGGKAYTNEIYEKVKEEVKKQELRKNNPETIDIVEILKPMMEASSKKNIQEIKTSKV